MHKVNLGAMPTAEDVRRIVEAFGLPWSEKHDTIQVAPGISDTPFEALRQLSSEQGLKAIIERIRLANDLAADDERDAITWTDFLTAHYAVERNAQAPVSGWGKEAA